MENGRLQIPIRSLCVSLTLVRCVLFKLKNILRSSDKRCYKMKSDGVFQVFQVPLEQLQNPQAGACIRISVRR